MSQENVESLRAAHAAFNRRDFDAAVALARPDVEFTRPGLEAPLRGVAAVREWMEPDAFEEQRIEPLQFEVNGNRVLMCQRTHARGAESGIELDVETWTVFTFDEDGLIARSEVYSLDQEDEALEAAGVSE
jgi:ketosteroid isomerase-like protein